MTTRITWPTMRYGYKIVDDEIVPEPTEQKVLKAIKRLTTRGHSSAEIAKRLNAKGYRTRNRTPWAGRHHRHPLDQPTHRSHITRQTLFDG